MNLTGSGRGIVIGAVLGAVSMGLMGQGKQPDDAAPEPLHIITEPAGRYQIVVHPLAVKGTYLIDTMLGQVWTPMEVIGPDDKVTCLAWEPMTRFEQPRSSVQSLVDEENTSRLETFFRRARERAQEKP